MEQFDDLLQSIWYGERQTDGDIDELKQSLNATRAERERILVMIELLKLGEFSIKDSLIHHLNKAQDEEVMNLSIKLFCSVASNNDLINSDNLLFITKLSEYNAATFSSYALFTLSYDVIPYLLVLLEEWTGTNVELTIRNTLDIFLNYSDTLGYDAAVDEIGNFYLAFSENINRKDYYFFTEKVFPGKLTKVVIENSLVALREKSSVKINTISSLLSIWSGKKCPVQNHTIMTDDVFKKVLSYVDELSTMDWNIGRKYFYGHQI